MVKATQRLIFRAFHAKSGTVINKYTYLFNKSTQFSLHPLLRLNFRLYIWSGSFFKLINPKP